MPVMLEVAVNGLDVKANGTYVDCTLGRGGHARRILHRLAPEGRLMLIDRDPAALAAVVQQEFASDSRCALKHGSFSGLERHLLSIGWDSGVDGVLMDLGVSSPQLDNPERGFSFQSEGPLDMRMDQSQGPTAAEWLSRIREEDLTAVLFEYGEERYARRIAKAIVAQRVREPIRTTRQLTLVVERAVPTREKNKHPATRTFQAIRIAINDELGELRRGLDAAMRVLRPGGRLVVISFHSLEDRIVKRFMRNAARAEPSSTLALVGKAQRAGDDEIQQNPRARSAVLRIAERLA